MIEGVVITPLRQIFDERGKVMHMLREDSPFFTRFGEIYFSCTHPGVVKAWHMHKETTLNYAVIHGEIKFVLFDDREGALNKNFHEVSLSRDNYFRLTVPPMVWVGFQGIYKGESMLLNVANIDTVVVKQKDKDLHNAIDIATDRVCKILRRHADKIKAHDATKLTEVAISKEEDSIAKELEKLDNEIVPMRLDSYKPIEIEEALNSLKKSDGAFKVFYDLDDNFRVLYKMKDGEHYGLY